MPVSGIAKRVASVATRKSHGSEMPTPPPIVIPSMIATVGFGYVNRRWLSRYSAKKNRLASAASSLPLRAIITTSPPAQKPRPSAWSMTTVSTLSSCIQPRRAALIVSHMDVLSAWIALGRFKRIRPTRSWVEIRTSSVTGAADPG